MVKRHRLFLDIGQASRRVELDFDEVLRMEANLGKSDPGFRHFML